MKQLIVLTSAILCFACHKDHDDTLGTDPVISPVQTALMAHTWVEDSLGYKTSDIRTVVFDEPKDRIRFGTSQYFTSAGTGPTADSINYELAKEPGKFYFWKESLGKKDTSQYYMIDALTDTSLVIYIPSTGVQTYSYYHAE